MESLSSCWLGLILAGRILCSPLANVFQKFLTGRGVPSLFVIVATHAILTAVCLPLLPVFPSDPPPEFWRDMAVVAVLTVIGNALLVGAVRRSDLSVLGPVNAYKSVVSLIPGMLLLGEFPGALGLAGIGFIVVGSYFIVDKSVTEPKRNAFIRFFTERGVQLRFAAMAIAAVEAVFLKRALLVSNAFTTFLAWAVLGFAISLLALVVVRPSFAKYRKSPPDSGGTFFMFAAVSTGLMQYCTIVVLGGFQVGYALALFQVSTLLSVFLGHRLFAEQNIFERLIGSLIMTAGAVLIVLQ